MNYNRVAAIYDFLEGLVFLDKLERASRYYFPSISKGSRVLIVGGGTGKALNHLQSNLAITFLDSSSRMISRAKKRATGFDVRFCHHDINQHEYFVEYDVIICNFFLDQFDLKALKRILIRIDSLLKPTGKLIITDFQETGKQIHRFALRLMYIFFWLSTGLQNQRIYNWRRILEQMNYLQDSSNVSMNGFIKSEIYQKLEL